MTAILHLNDNNLLVQRGTEIYRSQGFAWLKKAEVFFDLNPAHNAVKNSRIAPQQINNRYWQHCEQSAIAANKSSMRHSGDLIWRHLSDLKNRFELRDVVLVVPSHYQTANLELLLGIARACELNIVGVLNKAVMELAGRVNQHSEYLHIDVQLHQTVCSHLTLQDEELKLSRVDTVQQLSLQAMQDSLLQAIQQGFIQDDRFDPLHHAETEQQLFDQLPDLAKQLRRDGKVNVLIEHQGRQHSTSLDIVQWDAALAGFAKQLSEIVQYAPAAATPASAYLSANGFQPLNLPQTVVLLSDPSSEMVAAILQTASSDGPLHYRSSVRVNGSQPLVTSSPPEHQPAASNTHSNSAATHLLQGGLAVPIQHATVTWVSTQLQLQRDDKANLYELIDSGQLFIVGDAERKTIKPNDRLGSNLADGVITVVRVLD